MQPITKIFKKRLKSTNLYADKLVSSGRLKEPAWIRTDDQFAGKGQGDHAWVSEPGKNLTGSLVLFPQGLSGSDQFVISMVLSLAAADFLELFLDNVSIKWPNDLYAGNRKIGGILIETAIMGSSVKYAVLGIGLNINQTVFPSDLPNPVSLTLLSGTTFVLDELEDLFLESFRNRYRMIEQNQLTLIRQEYLKRLYRFREFAPYHSGGKWFRAKITGISRFGHLVLEDENGKVREFAFQEVDFIY